MFEHVTTADAAALAAAGLVIFLVGVIKIVGGAYRALLLSKKAEVDQRVGVEKAKEYKSFAQDIWGVVEEHFRINEVVGDVMSAKIAVFDQLLLKKIPGLTQFELDILRQTIACEVNRCHKAVQGGSVDDLKSLGATTSASSEGQQVGGPSIVDVLNAINNVKVVIDNQAKPKLGEGQGVPNPDTKE